MYAEVIMRNTLNYREDGVSIEGGSLSSNLSYVDDTTILATTLEEL